MIHPYLTIKETTWSRILYSPLHDCIIAEEWRSDHSKGYWTTMRKIPKQDLQEALEFLARRYRQPAYEAILAMDAG